MAIQNTKKERTSPYSYGNIFLCMYCISVTTSLKRGFLLSSNEDLPAAPLVVGGGSDARLLLEPLWRTICGVPLCPGLQSPYTSKPRKREQKSAPLPSRTGAARAVSNRAGRFRRMPKSAV